MGMFHTTPRGSLESRLDEMLYTCVQPTQGWVGYLKAEPEMTFHLPPGPLALFLKKMVVERLTSGSWASGCDCYLLYTDHAQLWRGVPSVMPVGDIEGYIRTMRLQGAR